MEAFTSKTVIQYTILDEMARRSESPRKDSLKKPNSQPLPRYSYHASPDSLPALHLVRNPPPLYQRSLEESPRNYPKEYSGGVYLRVNTAHCKCFLSTAIQGINS